MDLSVSLRSGMPVYPGDPAVSIAPALTVPVHGANVLSLSIGSHSGTHVDAPYHVHDGWERLDALPPARFSGPVELVDVRSAGPGGIITAGHLDGILPAAFAADAPGQQDRILLLHTGFSEHWESPEYVNHPFLDASAARLIVERGYRTVGLDALSVDKSAGGTAGQGDTADGSFPAHHILAGSGCAIVENLTGLGQVANALADGAEVDVFLFPLNIPGADGAPIRAVARATFPDGATQAGMAGMRGLTRTDVEEAAARLVAAFAATDTERYFACFSPSATFIFHPEPAMLGSRDEYRTLWDGWIDAGWKVVDCRSSEQQIQLLGDTAVFTHRVETTVQTDPSGATAVSDERETIVFTRTGGVLAAVHEHLSPVPPHVPE